MANDYYEENFTGFDGGRATAEQVVLLGQNVQAGFDKLPGERELKENRVNYGIATGNGTVFEVTLRYPITSYVDGMFIAVKMPETNAGAATINVDGNGSKRILDIQERELQTGQWRAAGIVGLRYTDKGGGFFLLQGGGIRGDRGSIGMPGLPYNFATDTAMVDPGGGKFRFNHATPAQITAIAVADDDVDGNTVGDYIAAFDDYGSAAARGHLIFSRPNGTDALVFLVTGSVQDNSGWTRLTVTHVSGASLPNTDDVYGMRYQAIGVPGATTPVATTAVQGRTEIATNAEIDAESAPRPSIVPNVAGLYRAIARKLVPSAFAALTFAPAQRWNVRAVPKATLQLTADLASLTLDNAENGGVYFLRVKQDATGGRAFPVPAGWKGSEISIPTAANAEILIGLMRVGTDIWAAPLEDE